ncbi:MAG: ATP-binding protein [Epsilonproteobacteria bacterium]|nr:ATP-binding protein [Campylobacterota bacterium]
MRAIALFSGGLDSCLAIKIIQEMGIEVIALHINTGFDSNFEKFEYLKHIAEQLGVEFCLIDHRKYFIENILFSPKYGYGKNFNPCIDCHANMINTALEYMHQVNAKFIISGEVLNQRPMSQKLDGLRKIEKLSKQPQLVLRPLSAKLLPPTIAEENGWVDREKLYAISGRDRKTQLLLAQKYSLTDFQAPAGGCLLTDKNFSLKLKSFIQYNKLEVEDIDILKVGRHFVIDNHTLIIARNKDENQILKQYNNPKFLKIFPINIKGPVGLISKDGDYEMAAKILLSYTKAKEGYVKIDKEYFVEALEDRSQAQQYLVY